MPIFLRGWKNFECGSGMNDAKTSLETPVPYQPTVPTVDTMYIFGLSFASFIDWMNAFGKLPFFGTKSDAFW